MNEKLDHKNWDNAILVFDTCSLGCIYTLTRETQIGLVEILRLLQDKIWIPAHVKLEFSIHHNKLLYQAISDCYPNSTNVKHVENYIDSINELLEKLKEGTFHPYYSAEAQEAIRVAKDRIVNDVKLIERIKEEQKNIQKELIDNTAKEDSLLELFETLNFGEGFTLDEMIAIAEEGESRYKRSVPPGYMDSKEKHGLQMYGDLIVWKEIIREAKKQVKNVVLVSEDVKEDWQKIENGVDMGVRQELKDEFQRETGCTFYKYTLDQFITNLQELYPQKAVFLPIFGKLTAVQFALQIKEAQKYQRTKSNNRMLLRCDCGHEFEVDEGELSLDFENDGYTERNMGPEYEYKAQESVSCPLCRKTIDLDMHVWEYPVGAFNYQIIEAKGTRVLREPDLSDVTNRLEEWDTCCECGERKKLIVGTDICMDCYDRKWEKLENE